MNDGGWIKLADTNVFPASENLIGALVYAAPYSLRQMHWHITAAEWQFMLNGTVEVTRRWLHVSISCSALCGWRI